MIYILRQGEISLKGKNKSMFEKSLSDNVKRICTCKVTKSYGRLFVDTEDKVDFRRIFGVVSYSPAVRTEKNYEDIEKAVLELATFDDKKTFRISAQRMDKSFPIKSSELNIKLGDVVNKKTNAKVKLENPDVDIGVEISNFGVFIFSEKIRCFGGLPVGCEGTVVTWIEDEKSLLSALLMMKRGCYVIPAGPDELGISLLRKFGCKDNFMILRDIKEVESFCGKALVVPDTLETFKKYEVNLPILRPLIAYDEEQIELELKKYESIP